MTERQLEMSQFMLSHENKELKNSMHQSIFGYSQTQAAAEEPLPKHISKPFRLQTALMSVSGVQVESAKYINEGELPPVILSDVPITMRVS
jgi:hypothetical protein